MAQIANSVALTGLVAPTDSEDTYAITDPIFGIDGLRSVADVTERDNVTDERRREGMLVYVRSEQKYYQLGSGLSNTDWAEFSSGGGGDPTANPAMPNFIRGFCNYFIVDTAQDRDNLDQLFGIEDIYSREGLMVFVKEDHTLYKWTYINESLTWREFSIQFRIVSSRFNLGTDETPQGLLVYDLDDQKLFRYHPDYGWIEIDTDKIPLAGGTMTGPLILNDNPDFGFEGPSFQAVTVYFLQYWLGQVFNAMDQLHVDWSRVDGVVLDWDYFTGYFGDAAGLADFINSLAASVVSGALINWEQITDADNLVNTLIDNRRISWGKIGLYGMGESPENADGLTDYIDGKIIDSEQQLSANNLKFNTNDTLTEAAFSIDFNFEYQTLNTSGYGAAIEITTFYNLKKGKKVCLTLNSNSSDDTLAFNFDLAYTKIVNNGLDFLPGATNYLFLECFGIYDPDGADKVFITISPEM